MLYNKKFHTLNNFTYKLTTMRTMVMYYNFYLLIKHEPHNVTLNTAVNISFKYISLIRESTHINTI